MGIVTAVQIGGFRSIDFDAFPLPDYGPMVGLNSAGKSNILRALNLYFNDATDENGTPVSWTKDRYDSSDRNEGIGISVEFDLTQMSLRKQQKDALERNGLTDTVSINKSWTFDVVSRRAEEHIAYSPFIHGGWDIPDAELRSQLLGIVRSIAYRYIPNHARPEELIRAQLQQLRPELIQRLRATQSYRSGKANAFLEELSRVGQRMFEPTRKAIRDGSPNVDVVPEFPTDFAELAFELGVQAVVGGGAARDLAMAGSGTQSFAHLHFLDMADRSIRRRSFGWIQGSIWAMEEPESFLHAGLRTRYARDLMEYSRWQRRQVLFSTHQDEFLHQAEEAFYVTRDSVNGTIARLMPSADALAYSTQAAVTSFQHPLLRNLDQPLVIVEGRFDVMYIRAAIEEAGLRPRWRVVCPDDDLQDGSSGSALHPYLKYSRDVLANRPHASPVLVLRDWEDKDISKYKAVVKAHPYSDARVAPEGLSNPALGQSFKGIERFLTRELVESQVERNDLLTSISDDSQIEIRSREALEAVKPRIAREFEFGVQPAGDAMVRLARWLDDTVEELIRAVPSSSFI